MNKNKSRRITNSVNILHHLLRKPMSRVELAEKNNLTKTTITEITKVFIEMGMIYEESIVYNEMGRPSIMLNFVKDCAYVIGIGVMRDGIIGCVIDAQGNLIEQIERKYNLEEIGLDKIYNTIDEILIVCKNRKISPQAISFGAPGPLDVNLGVIKCPPKLPCLMNVPLKRLINEKYDMFCCVENDADMAAIGEQYYGKGKTLDYFAYVFVGSGIGVGTIINSELYHGQDGFAGELGHIRFYDNGVIKILEEEYGMDGIIKKINSKFGSENCSRNINEVADLIISNNNDVLEILKEAGNNIGNALLTYINLFGISRLFIGGKSKVLGKVFLDAVVTFIRDNLFYEQEIRIDFSDMGEFIVPLGAARNGLFKYLESKIIENF